MSRETDKAMRELHKYLDAHPCSTEEELQQRLQDYMKDYNQNLHDREPDAFDYVEMAKEADQKSERKKYIEKALELDPENIEAKYLQLLDRTRDNDEIKHGIEKLLEAEQKRIDALGYPLETHAGEYYRILPTRPLMYVYSSYVGTMVLQGRFKAAQKACEHMLYMNEMDNLGIRYQLMVIYALQEDVESAEKLRARYDTECTSFLLMPMVALYYKLDDVKKAESVIDEMAENNKNLSRAVRFIVEDNTPILMNAYHSPYYRPYSDEEVLKAYFEHRDELYDLMDGFFDWMYAHMPKRRRKKNN